MLVQRRAGHLIAKIPADPLEEVARPARRQVAHLIASPPHAQGRRNDPHQQDRGQHLHQDVVGQQGHAVGLKVGVVSHMLDRVGRRQDGRGGHRYVPMPFRWARTSHKVSTNRATR